MRRPDIDQLAEMSDLDPLNLKFASIDDVAGALLGFQRTKLISRRSRIAWENGNTLPMTQEVKENRSDIVRGTFLEIYREYLPLRQALEAYSIKSVCDIGCGQGINDVFLHRDFKPDFTLVDIEETESQYHLWSEAGSGYASLDAAKRLLEENGVAGGCISTINPRKAEWAQTGHEFSLVTSLYSCGFHYPVDEYLELFVDTIEAGGLVCLDVRKGYFDKRDAAAMQLLDVSDQTVVYRDRKSVRYLFHQTRGAV